MEGVVAFCGRFGQPLMLMFQDMQLKSFFVLSPHRSTNHTNFYVNNQIMVCKEVYIQQRFEATGCFDNLDHDQREIMDNIQEYLVNVVDMEAIQPENPCHYGLTFSGIEKGKQELDIYTVQNIYANFVSKS